jgi:hypothetical protein
VAGRDRSLVVRSEPIVRAGFARYSATGLIRIAEITAPLIADESSGFVLVGRAGFAGDAGAPLVWIANVIATGSTQLALWVNVVRRTGNAWFPGTLLVRIAGVSTTAAADVSIVFVHIGGAARGLPITDFVQVAFVATAFSTKRAFRAELDETDASVATSRLTPVQLNGVPAFCIRFTGVAFVARQAKDLSVEFAR